MYALSGHDELKRNKHIVVSKSTIQISYTAIT